MQNLPKLITGELGRVDDVEVVILQINDDLTLAKETRLAKNIQSIKGEGHKVKGRVVKVKVNWSEVM